MLDITGVVSVDENGKVYIDEVLVEEALLSFIGKKIFLSVSVVEDDQDI